MKNLVIVCLSFSVYLIVLRACGWVRCCGLADFSTKLTLLRKQHVNTLLFHVLGFLLKKVGKEYAEGKQSKSSVWLLPRKLQPFIVMFAALG